MTVTLTESNVKEEKVTWTFHLGLLDYLSLFVSLEVLSMNWERRRKAQQIKTKTKSSTD